MDWPHAPVHRLSEAGAYIVTASTYGKQHFFEGKERLALLQDALLALARRYGWRLQAWAVFSNHYHFVATTDHAPANLPKFLGHLHTVTATGANRLDAQPGRKVWFQYWDTLITFERSYLARLNYVHNNPVKHGIVSVARSYPWCSAGWFERTADKSFFTVVTSFKTDRVNVTDDFDPIWSATA